MKINGIKRVTIIEHKCNVKSIIKRARNNGGGESESSKKRASQHKTRPISK